MLFGRAPQSNRRPPVSLFTGTGERGKELLSGILPFNGQPPVRGTREFLKGYSTMPWLRATSNRVATSIASVEWNVYATKKSGAAKAYKHRGLQRSRDYRFRQAEIRSLRLKGEIKPLENHPILDALDSSNGYLTGLTTRKLTQIHLDLTGEAFWMKERNGYGMPVAFWPIPPSWIMGTPTPAEPYYRVSFMGWQDTIPDTEVLWFNDPDPLNPYGRGTGVSQSLGDELETDEYVAKHLKTWFYNRARPDLIVAAKGMSREDTARLEQDWQKKLQGFWRAYKTYFLNQDVQIHELNQTFESMQLVELRQYERDTIVQVWGVPPEILGIIENSNRSTIDAADYLYARWVLQPRLEFLRAVLQERLIPEYDDRLLIDYVSPIQEDKEFNLKVMQAAPFSGTVNEWRTLRGAEPLDDGQGELFAVPVNITFKEKLEEAEPPAALDPNLPGGQGNEDQVLPPDDGE